MLQVLNGLMISKIYIKFHHFFNVHNVNKKMSQFITNSNTILYRDYVEVGLFELIVRALITKYITLLRIYSNYPSLCLCTYGVCTRTTFMLYTFGIGVMRHPILLVTHYSDPLSFTSNAILPHLSFLSANDFVILL